MSEKKFIVNPDSEIIITVPKRTPSANEILMRRPAPSKGMIRARRNDDFLPRRLQNRGIRIYNLGRIRSAGVETDLNFISLPEPQPYYAALPELTDEIFDQLFNLVFADAETVNSLNSTRPPIRGGEAGKHFLTVYSKTFEPLYSYDNPGDQAKFTGADLRVPRPQDIGLISIIDGENCYTLSDYTKITTAFDPDAPTAEFEFNGSEDVFMMPRLFFIHAFAVDGVYDATAARHSRIWFLNYLFGTLPDALLSENELLGSGFYNFLLRVIGGFPETGDPVVYSRVWRHIDRVRNYFSIRAGRAEFDPAGSVYGDFEPTSVPEFAQPSFPNDRPVPTLDPEILQEEFKQLVSEVVFLSPDNRRLLAVVYQGANKFFFWQPETI